MLFRSLLIVATFMLGVPFSPAADRPLGLNLAGIADWSAEMVFVDAFKTSRKWISQAEGKPWGQGGPLDVDERGNVRKLAPGQFAETLMFVDIFGRYPDGKYVCTWEGQGELRFGGAAYFPKLSPGRAELTVFANYGQISLQIRKTDPTDPIRKIRFIMPGFEEKAEKEPFHPSLVNRLKGFRAIRFMDWGHTNNNPVTTWAERTTPEHCRQSGPKGVALEYQIALSNISGVDPWFCVPHLADDNYIREMAKLIKAKLDPARTVFLEYSNETWNGQFEQARYCQKQGLAQNLSKNAYEAQLRYSAKRSVEIFKLFEEEFGKDRLVRVLSAHSHNPWSGTTVMDFEEAYKHADAIAIAPYFGHRLGDPKTANQVATRGVDYVFAECRKDIAANGARIKTYAENAKKRGLKLFAYEGGQHLVGHGGAENNQTLTDLFHAVNCDPRMADLYKTDLEQWFALGGDLFCVFSSVSTYSKWGSWGVLQSWDDDEKGAPKMRAIREFMAESRK